MKKFSEMLEEALKSENVERDIKKMLDMLDVAYEKMVESDNHDDKEEKVMDWHFDMEKLKKATKGMINEDGTTGAKWTVEQTSGIMKDNALKSDMFNEYDFNYVMNMLYSDYYKLLGNDAMNYFKMAKYFLEDKDAPKGKAYRYYLAMHPSEEHHESKEIHKNRKDYDDYDDYEDEYIMPKKAMRKKSRRRYDYDDEYDDYDEYNDYRERRNKQRMRY